MKYQDKTDKFNACSVASKIANWVVGVVHACTLILAMLQLVASRRATKMFAPCQKRINWR